MEKSIVVIGGAVAGSETAHQFAQQGFRTIVIEKNKLPYGKIEDGLPKWHVKLRNREIKRIDEKLNHPMVDYIPNTTLGETISIKDLLNWNCAAIVLANGAWRDRPLPIDGIDEFENKGLIYQNDFIYWFNHQHEPDYAGAQYNIKEDNIIIGGGLASIDCAKASMFALVNKALKQKGIETNLFEMEHGIPKVLDKHNITFEELNIKPCTIYYRKRIVDMPLTPQEITDAASLTKAQKTRAKIIDHNKTKFLFEVQELSAPAKPIVEDGQLQGLSFNRTYADDNSYHKTDETFEVRTPQIISSIGSLPVPIEGLEMSGSVYEFDDEATCRLKGYEHVYALGNAVTGRGNINQSLKHATQVSGLIIADIQNKSNGNASSSLKEKVKQLQDQAEYNGNYEAWVKQHMPVRLEDMVEH